MARIPTATTIKTYLAMDLRESVRRLARGRCVFIIPSQDNWDDFGNNYYAAMHFLGFREAIEPVDMRLMFPGSRRTSRKVADFLGDEPRKRLRHVTGAFISILASEDEYQRLVGALGFTDATALLRELHDSIITRLEGEDEETAALASSVHFHQSVLRQDKTWRAWRQADRFLTPGPL